VIATAARHCADKSGAMIWFFQRQQSRLHYEIRRQTDGQDYELVITHPDGHQEIEQYADPSALLERSTRLEHNLIAAGWQPPQPRPRMD
jgi:hypothetical protein